MIVARLKRVFLLMNPEHGLKGTDRDLLQLLRQHGVSHQVVLAKADVIVFHGAKRLRKDHQLKNNCAHLDRIFERVRKEIQPADCEHPVALGELIACSAEKSIHGERIGINNLRWAILAATGLSGTKNGPPTRRLPANNSRSSEIRPQGVV